VLLERDVVVDGAAVEPEPVLEAGAAAALDRDAQDGALAVRILRETRVSGLSVVRSTISTRLMVAGASGRARPPPEG
jgi:hypothetical protein